MKTIIPIVMLAILSLGWAAGAEPNYMSLLAERSELPKISAAQIASQTTYWIKEIEVPDRLPLVRVYVGKYFGGGQEPEIGHGNITGGNGWKWRLKICVAMRTHEYPRPIIGMRPDWELSLRRPGSTIKGYDGWVSGSGSTYLGVSAMAYQGIGSRSGNGGGEVIMHKDIDMWNTHGPFDCAKLPFKIDTQATQREHAIPVFAWFPLEFDVLAKRDKLTAAEIPKGTVIVYAVLIEK